MSIEIIKILIFCIFIENKAKVSWKGFVWGKNIFVIYSLD
jgi:hypothetical protein